MKLLKLNGKYAVDDYQYTMIDDEDYERCSKYTWHIQKNKRNGYISIRSDIKINGIIKRVLLSRFINSKLLSVISSIKFS